MIKSSILLTFLLLTSCSSLLKYDRQKEDFKHEEFDRHVEIIEQDSPPPSADLTKASGSGISAEEKNDASKVAAPAPTTAKKAAAKKTVAQKSKAPLEGAEKPKQTPQTITKKSKVVTQSKPTRRLPEVEDDEGFESGQRRPAVDPFRVGEKVVHDVSYLGAKAGTLTMSVRPFATVNGKKTYNFYIDIKSSSFFSRVYAVDDQVQTFVDYEKLVPLVFKLNIRDSGQVKEAQSYFNFETLKANYWEHRYTEKGGHEEKKQEWTILPYSQNPFSGIFYMRVFKWNVGQTYAFRVADDEKNVSFSAKAIEKTKLKTDAGTFDAIKLKAEIVSHGNLAKASDFYMWISDDDRKFVLRIEVKLPIGSLVSEAVQIQKGN